MAKITNEQLLAYLQANKHIIKISAIAKASKITNLANIVNEVADSKGYTPRLTEAHTKALLPVINKLQIKAL